MMIRAYTAADEAALLPIYNHFAKQNNYVQFSMEEFCRHITQHPAFCSEHTFVLEENQALQGFVCGCTGAHIPHGEKRGYITCVALLPDADKPQYVAQLLHALENSFLKAGRKQCAHMFYNPMQLPWFIPNTPGHQHNNAPGVDITSQLFEQMQALGYQVVTRECAMYLNLETFFIPQAILEKEEKMRAVGRTVSWYNPAVHTGLASMLQALDNPLWQREITQAPAKNQAVLVALEDNTVAGFTGPVYPEASGRGYFTGIGVAPQWEGKGFGSLLFYRLCQAEKEAGSKYMSLFTGVDNPARNIYEKAGFAAVRVFGLLCKDL